MFTIDAQSGFSVLVSATPVLHFLLGEYRGSILISTIFVIKTLLSASRLFNIYFIQFLLKKMDQDVD
jgi:hypothetical protein